LFGPILLNPIIKFRPFFFIKNELQLLCIIDLIKAFKEKIEAGENSRVAHPVETRQKIHIIVGTKQQMKQKTSSIKRRLQENNTKIMSDLDM
jgi:hypothetical protein